MFREFADRPLLLRLESKGWDRKHLGQPANTSEVGNIDKGLSVTKFDPNVQFRLIWS
jgi:hypothetical protein